MIALPKIAAATGKHLPAQEPVTGSSKSGTGPPLLVIFAPVAVLALIGAAVALLNRRRRRLHDVEEETP